VANKDFSISFNFESANRTELILKKVTVVFLFILLIFYFCYFVLFEVVEPAVGCNPFLSAGNLDFKTLLLSCLL
jgi:hypothetical protein